MSSNSSNNSNNSNGSVIMIMIMILPIGYVLRKGYPNINCVIAQIDRHIIVSLIPVPIINTNNIPGAYNNIFI